MKLIMENWRAFIQNDHEIDPKLLLIFEEELKKVLMEQNPRHLDFTQPGAPEHLNFSQIRKNPCAYGDFYGKLMRALKDPENRRAMNALGNTIRSMGNKLFPDKQKKGEKSEPDWEEYGMIRIINKTDGGIYDLRATAWGPPFTLGDGYWEEKGKSEPVQNSRMFKVVGTQHEKPETGHNFVIPPNQALEFLAPNKSFFFTYEVPLSEGAFDIENPDEEGFEEMGFSTNNLLNTGIATDNGHNELGKDVIWTIVVKPRRRGNAVVAAPGPIKRDRALPRDGGN